MGLSDGREVVGARRTRLQFHESREGLQAGCLRLVGIRCSDAECFRTLSKGRVRRLGILYRGANLRSACLECPMGLDQLDGCKSHLFGGLEGGAELLERGDERHHAIGDPSAVEVRLEGSEDSCVLCRERCDPRLSI